LVEFDPEYSFAEALPRKFVTDTRFAMGFQIQKLRTRDAGNHSAAGRVSDDGVPATKQNLDLSSMSRINRPAISLLLLALPVFAGSAQRIRNFDKVDQHVYRGGQPTEEGFQYLAQLGVKTVVDLREADHRSRDEERMVTHAGMTYFNVPMTGLTPPTEAEITRILAILEGNAPGSVYVHCKRGADRTGAVIAAYHIEHDQWDNSRALKDAMAHGMSFFQFPRQNYIKNFRAHSVEAGIPSPAQADSAAPAITPLPAVAVR